MKHFAVTTCYSSVRDPIVRFKIFPMDLVPQVWYDVSILIMFFKKGGSMFIQILLTLALSMMSMSMNILRTILRSMF